MRVLIACEESQRVALEFRKMGYEAYSCDLEEAGGNCWRAVTDAGRKLDAELMYLTEPDSWEKLEEDLDKCVAEGTACTYFSKDGTCQSCSLSNITTGCSPKVIEDIVSRIRKLRGEA